MKKVNPKISKLYDIIGAGCGLILVVILLTDIILGFIPVTAGLKNSELPADAMILTGSAPGRNADIIVQIAASEDEIYQIKILEHKETAHIGTKSIRELPDIIYQEQSLKVDAIAGSSLTSIAIKQAINNAFESVGIKFGAEAAGDIPAPTNMDDAALAEYYGSAVFTDVVGGKISDAGTVVYSSGYGAYSDVLVAVLFDTNDSIIGLIVDASGESEDKGMLCQSREYTDLYIGATSGKEVDVFSGASFTSWAIQDAVDLALANLSLVKGA